MGTEQHTAGSLAKALGATLDGPVGIVCTGCSSVADAESGDATFMINSTYAAAWKTSKASIGIVPVGVDVPDHDPSTRALLYVADADLAMAYVLSLFLKQGSLPPVGIHPSAVVSHSATIGKDVRIGSFVIISDGAVIGDNVSMSSHIRIGQNCEIGAGTVLHAGVVIEDDCVLGSDCILYANVVIGTVGFGYRPNADHSKLVQIPHIGNVEIGNNVEIGANSCIDRGKFSATQIGNGTKIDNLVQIGHNCKIGHHCVIAATSGLAGSVEVGNWVQIGAGVGIAPHGKVGDRARIGSKSGVMHEVPEGEEWLGIPARRMKDTLRQWASVRKLPGILTKLARSEDS